MDNKILEQRTWLVIIITFVMMLAEIFYGIVSNSMGLFADGVHMGTHVIAFVITLISCYFAMKFVNKTEKINALGGFTSAILLGLTAIGIIWESVSRFIHPLNISFNEATTVAVLGLAVNLVCIMIMGGKELHISECFCDTVKKHEHENINFIAAYMHIVADALTSVLAIAALLLGKYFGWIFFDPIIGILGGIIIAKWTIDLLKSSSKTLLN